MAQHRRERVIARVKHGLVLLIEMNFSFVFHAINIHLSNHLADWVNHLVRDTVYTLSEQTMRDSSSASKLFFTHKIGSFHVK